MSVPPGLSPFGPPVPAGAWQQQGARPSRSVRLVVVLALSLVLGLVAITSTVIAVTSSRVTHGAEDVCAVPDEIGQCLDRYLARTDGVVSAVDATRGRIQVAFTTEAGDEVSTWIVLRRDDDLGAYPVGGSVSVAYSLRDPGRLVTISDLISANPPDLEEEADRRISAHPVMLVATSVAVAGVVLLAGVLGGGVSWVRRASRVLPPTYGWVGWETPGYPPPGGYGPPPAGYGPPPGYDGPPPPA